MEDTPIVDITVEQTDTDTYKIWFVALAGSVGPQIKLPKSLLVDLGDKINKALTNG